MIHVLKPKEKLRYEGILDRAEAKSKRAAAIGKTDDESLTVTELSEDGENLVFEKCLSSATCNVDEIQAFVVGGQSSRFWMLRKQINQLPRDILDKLPFFSWNCITLQLSHRDVDLVIRKDEDMKRLIRFLVWRMRTLDG